MRVEVQHDVTGNILNDGLNQYLYDAEGQVCAVMNLAVGTMTGYIYNAEGTRVAKGTISAWTCDINSNGFQPVSDYIIGKPGTDGTFPSGWPGSHEMKAHALCGRPGSGLSDPEDTTAQLKMF